MGKRNMEKKFFIRYEKRALKMLKTKKKVNDIQLVGSWIVQSCLRNLVRHLGADVFHLFNQLILAGTAD